MLRDGIYRLQYEAVGRGGTEVGNALAVLREGKVLGSDRWGGMFVGSCDFDPEARHNTVRLRLDVPPDGTLITGFSAGTAGAVIDIVGTIEPATLDIATVVDVAGAPVHVQLTYLGPLPSYQRSRTAVKFHEREEPPHSFGPHHRAPRHTRRRARP